MFICLDEYQYGSGTTPKKAYDDYIDKNGQRDADDEGLEWFEGTPIKIEVELKQIAVPTIKRPK
jgi:hypothetical protein